MHVQIIMHNPEFIIAYPSQR